ncbi:NADH dehydrogenase [Mesotoga sp. Brook.08.105.5.1]|jgi:NADH-quinone oxidoreductase subunit H|uniref:Formate hydrogenlyase subunit 4 n=1 Tax=Mesotoga prima TaxID=1184387 RepID=A0A101HQV6_9BACT|nr:complex I subunit 1 family protein [Mesotoga sp. Brook.08.105.5.1]KUK81396.1 MAG: Formate hydrogenlyase subunit 4 [Mesotoga prima]PVD17904.1 NADH dehydrogenase [Mesotoga sp. Brook.08.105.5.1]
MFMNIVITILSGIALLVVAFVYTVTLEGIARKIEARIQRRYGPPFWQNFIDIFKSLTKYSISHGFIFDFGILMALGGTIATVFFIPAGNLAVFPGIDNVFVVIYLLAIGLLGMAMSAVGSGNPNASIGIGRALAQMLGYELPFMIVILGVFFHHGTSSLSDLVSIQIAQGTYNAWLMPIGGVVAFVSLIGMLGKKPFDTFIAPAEIASGPLVEYSGKYLGMLMIQHALATFIEIGLFVNLFLGGGRTLWEFLLKFLIVYFSIVIISATIPRFRVEQAIKFYWKWPLIFSFVQVIIVVFVMGRR